MGSLKHLCHPRIACFLARYRSPWFVLLRVALHILNMLWGTKSCLSPLGNDYHFVLKGAQAQAGRPWPPSETAFPVSVHISKPLQDCLGLSWRPMSSVTSRLRSPGSGLMVNMLRSLFWTVSLLPDLLTCSSARCPSNWSGTWGFSLPALPHSPLELSSKHKEGSPLGTPPMSCAHPGFGWKGQNVE